MDLVRPRFLHGSRKAYVVSKASYILSRSTHRPPTRARGSMIPLTNTEILAPLIVGFALEHLEVDSLATEFEPLVAQFHREGMSEADIVNKLFALMQSRSIKVTSLKSTPIYSESPTATQNVLKWMNAQSTKAGRDQMQGVCLQNSDKFVSTLMKSSDTARQESSARGICSS